jgi:hypothetical protein
MSFVYPLNVFVAAVYTNGYKPGQARYNKLTQSERDAVNNLPHILESYHYVGRQRFVDDMRRDGAQVFLDSGAFSAYTLGTVIDLPTYCDYIIRNEDIIRKEDGILMASVLDGIGDPQETLDNQKAMEKLGAKPLPCFHYGEDESYLEYYLKNYEYITIGGMVGRSTNQLITWLDRIWEKYMTDGAGNPIIKAHGFGITSTPIMERYPWYSCDSSSWIQAAAFGSVVDPEFGAISVSDKSPSRNDKGQHATTFTEEEQAWYRARLESQGFYLDRLATVYESRAAYNLWAYCQINKAITKNKLNASGFSDAVQELF